MAGNRLFAYTAGLSGHELGFSLAEILVATLIVFMLLLPLASRCLAFYVRANSIVSEARPAQSGETWDWGPQVGRAQTGDQGVALSAASLLEGQQPIVGLWLNGWLVEERQLATTGSSVLDGGQDWSAVDGEIVIRVRVEAGAWGPPLRLLTPSASLPAEWLEEDGGVLVHLPEIGAYVLEGAVSAEQPISTSPYRRTLGAGGTDVALRGILQAWQAEAGRDLDVYF